MSENLISEETARKIALENIMRNFECRLRLLKSYMETGGTIYTRSGISIEDCYIYAVSQEVDSIGASRIICVSKENGEIVFDGNVGE